MFARFWHSARKRKLQSVSGELQWKQQIPEMDSLSSWVALIEFRIASLSPPPLCSIEAENLSNRAAASTARNDLLSLCASTHAWSTSHRHRQRAARRREYKKKINNDSNSSSSYIEQHTVIKTKLPNWSEWGSSKKSRKKVLTTRLRLKQFCGISWLIFFILERFSLVDSLDSVFFFVCYLRAFM